MTQAAQRIDSHQHFWKYNPASHVWMNDEMTVLKKDFMPADLLPFLTNCSLSGCVAVQASQMEDENTFLLTLANQYDFIKGIVGWVDLRSDKVSERLSYYQQFTKIKGFRHVIHDEVDIDFMLHPSFLRGVGLLNEYGFTYDVLIYPQHLRNTMNFIRRFPHQPFVIDHIAKPLIRENKLNDWKRELREVASFDNVCCKISGLVTEARWNSWQKEDFTSYLDAVVEMFGTDRLMYGSDWPVCTLSATYEDVHGIAASYFSSFSQGEQRKIFGANATKFYGL